MHGLVALTIVLSDKQFSMQRQQGMYRLLANAALLVMLLTASQASAQLRIEITESAGVQDRIPIAIVPAVVVLILFLAIVCPVTR